MKKFFLSLAVFVMALCANAQTNQYFWYNGNLMMGNPIAQIDSVTFGNEDTDSILIYLPRTIIKTVEVHDTTYVAVHDTLYIHDCDTTPKYMGHEYVDLGLPSGLLWATCNVGAPSPLEEGGFYSWGETSTKSSYNLSDYLYRNNPISLSDISGTEYDAARANWGGEWRMPTRNEVSELTSNCSWEYTTYNGVTGVLLRSNHNDNELFIPEVGLISDQRSHDGSGFWTSSECGSSLAYRAWEWSYISFSEREQGFQIRPVVNKDVVGEINSGSSSPTIIHDTVYITIHDTVCPNENPDTTHNGFRYVDLGLSVMWADANVGAENPEEYGGEFAWGETAEKEYYGYDNYAHGYYKTMSKYCAADGFTTLLPEDDAATVNMGGNWRTPTKEEWQELIDNTTITLDTINNHPGFRFTALNGKSIFIPRAGNGWFSRYENVGIGIFYWSSSLNLEHYEQAYHVTNSDDYYQPDNISPSVLPYDRMVGGSVRGVFSK